MKSDIVYKFSPSICHEVIETDAIKPKRLEGESASFIL